jgi:Spy/CpxP family protein refolding chaperone
MMKSRWSKFGGVLVLVGALASLAGCSSEGSVSQAPASEEIGRAPQAQEAAKGAEGDQAKDGEERREGHKGMRGGKHGKGHGPAHLLRTALHELDLSDAQKTTIKGAIDELREGDEDHGKDPGMFAALAEGVRAGSIDKAAIEAKLAKAGDAKGEEHRAKVASALSTLHATLTKEQRRALVDKVAAKMEERGERGPKGDGEGRRGPKGDGEGWGGPKGERMGWGGHGMKGGPLGHMLRDLDLSAEQRAQIDKALEANRPSEADMEEKKEGFEAKRAEMKARMESFAADNFDAKAFVAGGAKEGKGPKAHLDRMVTSLAAVLPILTPAQRSSLADQLEKGPMGKPGRGEKRGEERR